jgi:hypothetical protein
MSDASASATQFDGHEEARRRAALLRSDPAHQRWVQDVRSQLARGPYVSRSERVISDDRRTEEDSLDG